ncbi:DNA replication and repair protein RecN [Tamilnaduibacter salinus]|uniref:DNA repair protein RecN n=1 Tax=Tamilnaduibacter salinus TaxID=1484056 RepID=A0A2U1CW29_9GAMM|nr:DNA repair protein RecN [Tamilnaduibacter salinus]PVY75959.1 DNA replication and repair protein RecN [Tamilnaduibacter salinus]
MLTQLTVSNYAIAEKVELQFRNGMTTLTGETGAGKSIVLDALSLILGGRADASAVRHGAKRADITASFDITGIPAAAEWLEERELDADGECLMRRVISREGRSRAYINGQPCPLSHLRGLGSHLMDIHSQHQHQSLLQKETHRILLDNFAGARDLAESTRTAYKTWHASRQKLDDLTHNRDDNEARRQLLRYQVDELDQLALSASELTELEAEQTRLSHAESVMHQSHQALLLASDDDTSAASLASQALQQLEQLPVAMPELDETLQMLSEAQIQLNEAGSNLRHFLDQYDADPQRLAEVEERLSTIYDLSRKHRVTPEQLPEHHESLRSELEELEGGDGNLEALAAETERLADEWQARADELSERRQNAAMALDEKIASELAELSMPAVQFVTHLARRDHPAPSPNGHEDIEFLISANPGQPARSLAKVASGGELSRISLAIQVVVAQTSTIPTLVFDEVDVGIGGGTAEVVGRLLRQLGSGGQILCVTHLPQVAAQAHQHLFVSKFSEKDSTWSQVETLDKDDRIKEVARMLGGMELTDQTMAHAQEMFQKGQALHH